MHSNQNTLVRKRSIIGSVRGSELGSEWSSSRCCKWVINILSREGENSDVDEVEDEVEDKKLLSQIVFKGMTKSATEIAKGKTVKYFKIENCTNNYKFLYTWNRLEYELYCSHFFLHYNSIFNLTLHIDFSYFWLLTAYIWYSFIFFYYDLW